MCPNRKLQLGQWGQLAISILDFKLVSPLRIQKSVVHEPSLQLLQFAAHLPPLFCKAPCFCTFLFCELPMRDFRRDETRTARLGCWSCCEPAVESTAMVMLVGWALARRASAGLSLAPWSGIIGPKTPV
jgi:hypothetical protein